VRLLVLSPHYDDAPLSLGQSLIDGVLSRHEVTVGVVFGHSAWVRWFHPTRRRSPVATAIRRVEEHRNSRRFGYRLVTGGREEATLRLGTTDTARYLDPNADPSASGEVEPALRVCVAWAERHDAVLAPLGIGDHLDHLILAEVGRRLGESATRVGFYAERPYATMLDDSAIDERAAAIDPEARLVEASGPIPPAKRQGLGYPSQFDEHFVAALHIDEEQSRRELLYLRADLTL